MSDWLTFRAAMVAAVERAIPANVLALTGVAWAGGARPHARWRVLLSVVSAVFDDRDTALSTGGVQVLDTMAAITVQITCESTYDSGDADALWLIEQLRLGLRKVSVAAALEAAGILVQTFPSSTRNIGGVTADRALSVHAIELTLCTSFALVPGPPEDAGLIERVQISGTVLGGNATVGATDTVSVDVLDPNPEP